MGNGVLIAQLSEHDAGDGKVMGSIPAIAYTDACGLHFLQHTVRRFA